MINTKELLFVVDEFDTPLKPLPRHQVFKKGLWRRTAHVWVINNKNQILCQRRSLLKDTSPGKWEPAIGGHLGPNDNYFTGAARELFEETGIEAQPEDLNLFKIYKDHERKEYRGIFYYRWDGEIHEIISEEEEVAAVKFLHVNTLKKYLNYKRLNNWITSGYESELFTHLKTS